MAIKKSYLINEKRYTQQALVIGQIPRLLEVIGGVKVFAFTPMGILTAFGDRLPLLMACVLLPDGRSPGQVDIDALAAELEPAVDVEKALEVLDDFLELTPVLSVFERLTGMMNKMTTPAAQMEKTPGNNSSASSPEETSAKQTTSAGE